MPKLLADAGYVLHNWLSDVPIPGDSMGSVRKQKGIADLTKAHQEVLVEWLKQDGENKLHFWKVLTAEK
jgi:hypothetical protein